MDRESTECVSAHQSLRCDRGYHCSASRRIYVFGLGCVPVLTLGKPFMLFALKATDGR